jgi:hypothetical protein
MGCAKVHVMHRALSVLLWAGVGLLVGYFAAAVWSIGLTAAIPGVVNSQVEGVVGGFLILGGLVAGAVYGGVRAGRRPGGSGPRMK